MDTKIAIIIPIYNNLSYTKKCIDGLKKQIYNAQGFKEHFEIVVIDDNSTDGSSNWLTNNHPEVHVLHGSGSFWWSGCINSGITYSIENIKAQYVLLWNNDIVPAPNYFEVLLGLLAQTPKDTILGSKVLSLTSNKIWGMGGYFNPKTGKKRMFGENSENTGKFNQSFEVDWFPGMGTVIPTAIFHKTGLLDSANFPQYHGDSDITWRAKRAGYKLIATPELIIYNDITNTGIKHENNFKRLIKSLTDIKSNYNIRKDIKFYSQHKTSILAYRELLHKYGTYIGGFLKWKILAAIGKSRNKMPLL